MNYEYKKSKNKESEAIISLNDDFFNNYFGKGLFYNHFDKEKFNNLPLVDEVKFEDECLKENFDDNAKKITIGNLEISGSTKKEPGFVGAKINIRRKIKK